VRFSAKPLFSPGHGKSCLNRVLQIDAIPSEIGCKMPRLIPVLLAAGAGSDRRDEIIGCRRAANPPLRAFGLNLFDATAREPIKEPAPTMPNKKVKVIVTRRLPDPVETRLKELFDAELNPTDTPMSTEQLADAMARADVLVPTLTDRLDGRLLGRAGPNLRLIAQFGAGVDNIDVQSATSRGITITNTPGVLTEDTADMTMALILAVPRRLLDGVRAIEEDAFTGWSPTWMLGRRIWGKRLGIIGMGRIGQALARRAKAFGLQIHYHNRKRVSPKIEETLEATYWESLDQMLSRMDIISVNCPHTPGTYHLLSTRRLELLKPTAYIVNTSRGEVIDEAALARLIKAGKIAGAGLDVFEHEPMVNPKLKALPNVVLVPHMGSATLEGRLEMGEKVIINIKTFVDGHKPPDRVIPAML
jgi:glyoxylate reductase